MLEQRALFNRKMLRRPRDIATIIEVAGARGPNLGQHVKDELREPVGEQRGQLPGSGPSLARRRGLPLAGVGSVNTHRTSSPTSAVRGKPQSRAAPTSAIS